MIDEIRSITDIQTLIKQGNSEWSTYGYVTVKGHDGLLIFNYNAMAQYHSEWNFFERVSRGLIFDAQTAEIVARGFDKFYNWFEGGRVATGHIVTVTEKMDGSLGILYRHRGQYHITTRGDLTSPQGEWATEFLNTHYDLTGLDDRYTLLFEIIYPDNRIIVDYGSREDLVLLAARNRFTGKYLPFFPDVYELAHQYGFTLPTVYTFNDVTQLIEQTGMLDSNHEGYVVEFADGSRFKFKSDRYLELHKLITSLTFKNILRAMQNNNIQGILDTVPDEFLDDVKTWIQQIETTVNGIQSEVEHVFNQAPKDNRKQFAMWINKHHRDLSTYLFAHLDNRPIKPLIYEKHDWSELTHMDVHDT